MKSTKLVICYHFGRCGSTLLNDSLSQNSNIDSASELFTLLSMKGIKSEAMSMQDALSHIESCRQKSKKPILFLEIKPMNFLASNTCGFLKLHKQLAVYEGAKTIYLKRDNVLKRIVSSDKASESGLYHIRRGDEKKQKSDAISLNLLEGYDYDSRLYYTDIVDRLDQNINLESRIVSRLKCDASSFLKLSYETNLASEKALRETISDINSWLSIEDEVFDVNLVPTTGGLKKDLKNFEEVKKVIGESRYSQFLQD